MKYLAGLLAIALACALIIVPFILPIPARAQDVVCADYFDGVFGAFLRTEPRTILLDPEMLERAKELYNEPKATRAFSTYFNGEPVFGFEVDGCLEPPVPADRPADYIPLKHVNASPIFSTYEHEAHAYRRPVHEAVPR